MAQARGAKQVKIATERSRSLAFFAPSLILISLTLTIILILLLILGKRCPNEAVKQCGIVEVRLRGKASQRAPSIPIVLAVMLTRQR